eukprot:scaffold2109_cov123-Isochrysis_galbana.AAC.24
MSWLLAWGVGGGCLLVAGVLGVWVVVHGQKRTCLRGSPTAARTYSVPLMPAVVCSYERDSMEPYPRWRIKDSRSRNLRFTKLAGLADGRKPVIGHAMLPRCSPPKHDDGRAVAIWGRQHHAVQGLNPAAVPSSLPLYRRRSHTRRQTRDNHAVPGKPARRRGTDRLQL